MLKTLLQACAFCLFIAYFSRRGTLLLTSRMDVVIQVQNQTHVHRLCLYHRDRSLNAFIDGMGTEVSSNAVHAGVPRHMWAPGPHAPPPRPAAAAGD